MARMIYIWVFVAAFALVLAQKQVLQKLNKGLFYRVRIICDKPDELLKCMPLNETDRSDLKKQIAEIKECPLSTDDEEMKKQLEQVKKDDELDKVWDKLRETEKFYRCMKNLKP